MKQNEIKKHRLSLNMTQEQFAEHTGYSRSAIQKFESGRRTPPKRSLSALLGK